MDIKKNQVVCEKCSSIVLKKGLKRHQKTKKCLKSRESKETIEICEEEKPKWKTLYEKFRKSFEEGEVADMITCYTEFGEFFKDKAQKKHKHKNFQFVLNIKKLKNRFLGVDEAVKLFNIFEDITKITL